MRESTRAVSAAMRSAGLGAVPESAEARSTQRTSLRLEGMRALLSVK